MRHWIAESSSVNKVTLKNGLFDEEMKISGIRCLKIELTYDEENIKSAIVQLSNIKGER